MSDARHANSEPSPSACTENLTGEHDLFDEYLFNDARHAIPAPEAQQAYLERIKTLTVTKE